MVYTYTISKELQEQARNELNEVPERVNEDIEHIRNWIKKQPHLHIRTDDKFILRFLRGCKFSLEKTKEKIDMHFTLKEMVPEWYKGRDPKDPKLRSLLELGILLPLRDVDDEGRSVFLMRQFCFDPKNVDPDELSKSFYILGDVWYELNESHQIKGVVMVGDMKGMTAAHMLHFPITSMKKGMVLWQEGYVLRNKCIHYINIPSLFESMYNVVKGFMNEKIRNRVKIHGADFGELYKDVPKRIMPAEYGGEGGTIKEITDYWMEIIDSHRDWILEDQKNRVEESKRPGKPKSSVDVFGLEGSFRKLNVD